MFPFQSASSSQSSSGDSVGELPCGIGKFRLASSVAGDYSIAKRLTMLVFACLRASGVNFTNILREPFPFRSFSPITVWVDNFLSKGNRRKPARKMLVKLTTGTMRLYVEVPRFDVKMRDFYSTLGFMPQGSPAPLTPGSTVAPPPTPDASSVVLHEENETIYMVRNF